MPGMLPLMGRRHFLASAAIGAVGAFVPFSAAHAATTPPSTPGAETLTPVRPAPAATTSLGETALMSAATAEQSGDTSIRPFHVHIAQSDIDDMRRRIRGTRWPDKETAADRSQGFQRADLQALLRYWGTTYDWRKAEARLNALPQYKTRIDGIDIHFIQVKSKNPHALP